MTTPNLPLSDDPRARASQMAMIKVLSTPPEPLLNLFERLQIPWERVVIDGESCCIIKWADLMTGETRNQAEGPFIKKVVEEMQANIASQIQPPELQVARDRKVERPKKKTVIYPKENGESGE
jgi:hypothetical protein